jgi:hypothetical protein
MINKHDLKKWLMEFKFLLLLIFYTFTLNWATNPFLILLIMISQKNIINVCTQN